MEKKIKAKDLMEWLDWKFENFNEWKHKDNTEISLNENGITIFDGENVYDEISTDEIEADIDLLCELKDCGLRDPYKWDENDCSNTTKQGGGQ